MARLTPAKGVGRETGARVQISLSPPFIIFAQVDDYLSFYLQMCCKFKLNKLTNSNSNSIIYLMREK